MQSSVFFSILIREILKKETNILRHFYWSWTRLVGETGYEHQLKTKRPVLLNIELSVPSGKNLVDDFTTEVGCRINFYKTKNFYFTAKAQVYSDSTKTIMWAYKTLLLKYWQPAAIITIKEKLITRIDDANGLL